MVGKGVLGAVVVTLLTLSACGDEEPQPAFETPPPSTAAASTSTTSTVAAAPTTSTTTTPPSTAPPTTSRTFCEAVDTPTEPVVTAQVGDLDGDEIPEGIAVFDTDDGSGLLLVSSSTRGPMAMEIPRFSADIYTKPSIAGADIDKDGDVELFFPMRQDGLARVDVILEPDDCELTPVTIDGATFELAVEDSAQRIALFRCGNGTVVTVTGPARGQQSTATVYKVSEGVAEERYTFRTGANAADATGVGQRCSGVADKGPGPRPR